MIELFLAGSAAGDPECYEIDQHEHGGAAFRVDDRDNQ
jgi:hypothetical protein